MKNLIIVIGIIILFYAGLRVFNTFSAYLGIAMICTALVVAIYLTYILIFKNSKQNEKNL